jgi:hypothetical protein
VLGLLPSESLTASSSEKLEAPSSPRRPASPEQLEMRIATNKKILALAEEELEKAGREFCQQGIRIEGSEIHLPKVIDWYK